MRIQKQEYQAIIGLDWADKKHDICLITLDDTGGRIIEYSVVEHDPGEVHEWARRLQERFGQDARIAVALELERGPVVAALLEYDIFVLFPSGLTDSRSIARLSRRREPKTTPLMPFSPPTSSCGVPTDSPH